MFKVFTGYVDALNRNHVVYIIWLILGLVQPKGPKDRDIFHANFPRLWGFSFCQTFVIVKWKRISLKALA